MKQFLISLLVLVPMFAFGAENVDAGFFTSFIEWVKSLWGETPTIAKVASGIVLLVSSMKVSFLKPAWDALVGKQDWVAPVLGLVGGIATMLMNGKFDFSLLLTAVAGGALAPYLHDLLDKIKDIPGIGKAWLTAIEVIKLILNAPKKTV